MRGPVPRRPGRGDGLVDVPRPLDGPFLRTGEILLPALETGSQLPTSWYLWPTLSGLGGYLVAVVATATALHAREQRRERRRTDA